MFWFSQGTYLILQAFGKCMIENGIKDGSIIAISSCGVKVIKDKMFGDKKVLNDTNIN